MYILVVRDRDGVEQARYDFGDRKDDAETQCWDWRFMEDMTTFMEPRYTFTVEEE